MQKENKLLWTQADTQKAAAAKAEEAAKKAREKLQEIINRNIDPRQELNQRNEALEKAEKSASD